MWNYIAEKCMARGPAFNQPTIYQRVYQYNAKYVLTPILAPVGWKPNPPIAQHCHHHALCPAIPDINFTETISTNMQIHLSDLLYSLYSNDYSLHEPPHGPTPSYACVTHDTNDSIKTALKSESITPHITVFYNGDVNQVPVS